MSTVTCSCWCENGIVAVPVEWVSEGRTAPCDLPDCEPGCPSRATDAFDEIDESDNEAVDRAATLNRKRFMMHDYDPAADSSPDIPASLRDAYPGLILRAAEGTCGCGCGANVARKARFRPGHDAKLKGRLQRAAAARVSVHEIGPDGSVNSTSALDVARFYGWEAIVAKGAERIVARSSTPIAAEKRLMRIAQDGREGYELLETSRWDKTGRLLTTWRRADGAAEAMYVTPEGTIETVEVAS